MGTCGMIRSQMMFLRDRFLRLVLLGSYIILFVLPGCGGSEGSTNQVFREAYSFYVTDLGPFSVSGPTKPSNKEFLVLQAGEVEISCGRFVGAMFGGGNPETALAAFARQTFANPGWLPGCNKWLLDAGGTNIGERWFYKSTLLVRRDPALSASLTPLQRSVHARELLRYPDNVDRIVQVYHTTNSKDIYILTLSGSPEDVAALEESTTRLLASIKLSSAEVSFGGKSAGN